MHLGWGKGAYCCNSEHDNGGREHVCRRGNEANVGKEKDVSCVRERFKNVLCRSACLGTEIVLSVVAHGHAAKEYLQHRHGSDSIIKICGCTLRLAAAHRHDTTHVQRGSQHVTNGASPKQNTKRGPKRQRAAWIQRGHGRAGAHGR